VEGEAECPKCNDVCDGCMGPLPTECTGCALGRVGYPACSCPAGTWDDGPTKDCQLCHDNCETCTGGK